MKANNFRKSGSKIAYLYVLTPQGAAEKAANNRIFSPKTEEYELLRIEVLKGEPRLGVEED